MIAVKKGPNIIIPMHLNAVFLNKNISFSSSLDSTKIDSLLNNIDDNEYILDFSNISITLTSAAVDTLISKIENKKVSLVNMDKSIFDQINNISKKIVAKENDILGKYFSTTDLPSGWDTLKIQKYGYLYNYLEEECETNIVYGKKYLKSSNVWTNQYFDIRVLFSNICFVKIVVYLLVHKIQPVFNEYPNVKLLSSNINGSILANLVSLILNMPNIGIPHLGPEITIEDNRFIQEMKQGDKYIYVYDFIALGNEQKAINRIIRLFNAEIVKSIGIAFYKVEEDLKTKTDSIIGMTRIISNYHIVSEEKDIEKLLEE